MLLPIIIRDSNFPPEFFPAETIIAGKDELETGIPVNFRHRNVRRKAKITETFSGRKQLEFFKNRFITTDPWARAVNTVFRDF